MKKFQHDSRARVTRARVTHRRTLRLPGRLWRARPVRRPPTAGRRAQSVRGLLTAGRCACPAGYSGLSGGYSRRARTSRGCAPQRASQGEGRRPSPYVIPTCGRRDRIGRTPVRSVVNRQAAPAPLFAAQPVQEQRPPHCSRRSRLKFFAKLFFKKAGVTRALAAMAGRSRVRAHGRRACRRR